MDARFTQPVYLLKKKFFKIFGQVFNIVDPQSDELLLYSKQKAFKLKEDIRIFADTEMTQTLLTIKARQMLDISATYDITDAQTGEPIGALQRQGIKSILRDKWIILDASGQEIGSIQEDSMGLALVRRFLFNLFPQSFTVTVNGQTVGKFQQNWNFFVPKIQLDFSMNQSQTLDPRLGLGGAVLIAAIEGRQN
jgi:hypothetical protein